MKKRITIRIDGDVLEWFRSIGGNYQTAINDALRSYMGQVGMNPKPSRWSEKKLSVPSSEYSEDEFIDDPEINEANALAEGKPKKVIKTVEDIPQGFRSYSKDIQLGKKAKK